MRYRRRLRLLAVACLLAGVAQPSAGASPVTACDATGAHALRADGCRVRWGPGTLRALDDIRRLGANSVTLVPLWFQPTTTPSLLGPRPGVTTDDRALTAAVLAAQARGLHVTIKPQVDFADGSWRGDIAAADP